MILVNKESRGSYNAVIANVNQHLSKLIKEAEALVSSSESTTASQSESLNALIKKANNLLTYVNGLKEINKQIDANMPESCDYSWSYVENGCSYECSDSGDCGEDSCGVCQDGVEYGCGYSCSDSCDNDVCDDSCGYSCDDSCVYSCGDCSDSCDDSCAYCGE